VPILLQVLQVFHDVIALQFAQVDLPGEGSKPSHVRAIVNLRAWRVVLDRKPFLETLDKMEIEFPVLCFDNELQVGLPQIRRLVEGTMPLSRETSP
jgi:hypothetical protein